VAKENSASTEQVSAAAEEMSSQVEQITAATQSLGAMADELREKVSAFRLVSAEPVPKRPVPSPSRKRKPAPPEEGTEEAQEQPPELVGSSNGRR
jgi:hypothetical protein